MKNVLILIPTLVFSNFPLEVGIFSNFIKTRRFLFVYHERIKQKAKCLPRIDLSIIEIVPLTSMHNNKAVEGIFK